VGLRGLTRGEKLNRDRDLPTEEGGENQLVGATQILVAQNWMGTILQTLSHLDHGTNARTTPGARRRQLHSPFSFAKREVATQQSETLTLRIWHSHFSGERKSTPHQAGNTGSLGAHQKRKKVQMGEWNVYLK